MINRTAQGKAILVDDPEPWPEAVDGVVLLSQISELMRRFVVMASGARDAIALWVLMTYLTAATDILPILCITSPRNAVAKPFY